MGDYTFLRLEVSVRPVARVLERVPGVTVTGDRSDPPEEAAPASSAPPTDDARGGETPPPSEAGGEPQVSVDDETVATGGLTDRLPPVVREWGLLAVGVVFLGLGAASTALWIVLRRKRAGDESDLEEPTVDSFDEPVDEWRQAPTRADEPTTGERAAEAVDSEAEVSTTASTVLDQEPEPEGTGIRDPAAEDPSVAADEPVSPDEFEDAEEESERRPDREVGAIDVAPVLGMAFLATAAALVKWAQGESSDETTVR